MHAQTVPSHNTAAPGEKTIRVLVVDDSAVTRRILSRALQLDPRMHVVGTADGAERALPLLQTLRPDVVTLDIHMDGMSGLELLPILRRRFPRLRVLLFSSASEAGTAATIDALLAPGTAFMLKPFANFAGASALSEFAASLHRHVAALHSGLEPSSPNVDCTHEEPPANTPPACSPKLLAIGVSTGGPGALTELLSALPTPFSLPILIVQHMPADFTRGLAQRLAAVTRHRVREAIDGDRLRPGDVLLAPGGQHLTVRAGARDALFVALNRHPPECSCRPSVNVLFRSVAEAAGAAAIAVVLTGMGEDGRLGALQLHRCGAQLIAQDAATSVVWGMPGAVAPFADAVLPLPMIAPAICEMSSPRAA